MISLSDCLWTKYIYLYFLNLLSLSSPYFYPFFFAHYILHLLKWISLAFIRFYTLLPSPSRFCIHQHCTILRTSQWLTLIAFSFNKWELSVEFEALHHTLPFPLTSSFTKDSVASTFASWYICHHGMAPYDHSTSPPPHPLFNYSSPAPTTFWGFPFTTSFYELGHCHLIFCH